MTDTNESKKCGCGADAEWEATVKATGPNGVHVEVVPLCDACMRRSTDALVDSGAVRDVELEMES